MKQEPQGIVGPSAAVHGHRGPAPGGDEDMISLRDILSTIWREKWVVMLATILCFIVAIVAVSRLEPRYRASASVMFGTQKAKVIDLQEILADPEFSKDTLQNEVEVLRSTSLIERVVEELRLREDPEFNPKLGPAGPRLPGGLAGVAARLGLEQPPAQQAPPEEIRRRETLTAIDRVLAGLTLRPIASTRVIEISFAADDPTMAARVVNTIADQYIVDQLVAKLQTTRSAIEWLGGRVEEARQRLQEAEESVESLRANLSETAGQSFDLTQQQLVALNAALSAARGRAAQVAAQHQRLIGALTSGADMGAITEFRDSPLIRGYRDGESALTRRLAALSAFHPERARVEADLADMRARIRAEAESVVVAVGIDLEAARAQERSLAAAVRELETKGLAQSRAQVQLRQLEREAEASRQLYEAMLNRLKETSEQVELQEANARVLSPAEAPLGPESSRGKLIVAMAAVLGMVSGIGIVFLREQLRDTFRAPRRIEAATGLAVIATLPSIGRRRTRAEVIRRLCDKPGSSLAEAARDLRAGVLRAEGAARPKVVMFTSSVPREGKSTTALLVALTNRRMGGPTIVVDCDFRRPAAGRALGVAARAGLFEVLSGVATLDEAIEVEPDTGLHLLIPREADPSGPPGTADLLASERFRELIRTLSARYDLVVLDTPPTLVVADARQLCAAADAVVYVVRWDHTPRGAVAEGLRELAAVGAPIRGVALTMINEVRAARHPVDGYVHYRGRYRDYCET